VPTLGGVAIAIAIAISLGLGALMGIEWYPLLAAAAWPFAALLIGTLTIAIAGIWDDVRGLSAAQKLLFELIAALIALGGGFHFSAVTNPFSNSAWNLAWLGDVATVAWILLATNAVNLIDGLDGLATGVALIAALTLMVCSAAFQRPDAVVAFAVLAGALAGFLPYNFNPASIFLGDSGRLLIGYLLSVMSIHSLQKGTATVVIVVPMLALGLPILETSVTVLRRLVVSGVASVFRADRDHIHHRLVGYGFTQRHAVIILYAAGVVLGGLAYLAVTTRGTFDAVIVALVAIAMLLAVRLLGYTRR